MRQKREHNAGPRPALDSWTVDGRTVAVLAGMYGALLCNAWLYFALPGSLPLPLHVLIAAAAIHCAFTVWHEAAHRTVSKTRWLNDLVGVVGIFPYMTPFFLQKRVHLRHHQHVNDPEDPNLIYAGGPYWQLPYRYIQLFRYASELVKDDPRTALEKRLDYAALAAVASVYLVALVAGFLPSLLLLWLLPMLIAKVVMDWYINYLPHVGLPTDRYGATRVIDVAWLTPLVLFHNYHAIHHLWPSIPWHGYRAVFREKEADLRQRGMPIEYRVFAARAVSPVPAETHE